MQEELTCNQVNALMSFYLTNKLNEKLKEYVEYHLNICPKCKKKYEETKKKLDNYNEQQKETKVESSEQFVTQQYLEFKQNLSAYIDNELGDNENIRIKKITISNPLARKDLEDIYTYKKILHNSFEKTKNEFKEDYIKNIIDNIAKEEFINKKDQFIPLITAFSTTIFLLIITLIWFGNESGLFKLAFRFLN